MDQRKLYTTVGQGFRTTVKRALVSGRYPSLTADRLTMGAPSIVEGRLFESLNSVDELGVSAAQVVDGELEIVILPTPEIVDALSMGVPSVVSGTLRSATIELPNVVDNVTKSQPSVVSGTLRVVVVNALSAPDNLTTSQASIISGTLA